MSLSDLTRSYTTFPSISQSRTLSPVAVTTSASEGPSNVPGYSIAASAARLASSNLASAVTSSAGPLATTTKGGDGFHDGLALGLGLGLGLCTLVALFVTVFVLKTRKRTRREFEHRADKIRETMATAPSAARTATH
ncbi:hypothetical protein JCM10212_003923 [Sporobolomyces blumeae]